MNIFKMYDLKCTKQRLEVVNAIKSLDMEATIKNILNSCKSIDCSTVYRILDLLIDKNILEKRINYKEEI